MSEITTQSQINLRARYFYLGCVLLLGIRFTSSTLFSQLSQPVLINPGIDNTYWLFHWFGIPRMVTHSVVWSAVLDILLFLLPIIASIIQGRRIYAFLFTILIFVYQITYSTYSMHHYHGLIGILFLSIPFWFGQGQRFTLVWEAVRYYFFFIFGSAALWKLSTGGLWSSSQMSSILMAQHAQTLYEYPTSYLSQFHSYLISHAAIAQAAYWLGFLIQLSFWGGFFTRKFDKVYLALFVSFIITNFLLMHILSLDLLIFSLVLFDWHQIEQKQLSTTPIQ